MLLSVTGHRPDKLGGYSTSVYRRLREFAKIELQIIRPSIVLTGMALGWDQAVADACVDLDISFKACVPFKGQEARWPEESQTHYHELLAVASEVVYVSPIGYAVWKMQVRNKYMVDNSEQLLALWDGSKGGTANCVEYAVKKLIPASPYEFFINNCWTRWLDFTSVAA